MKTVRTIAMFTDHSRYGRPIEVTRVELCIDEHYPITEDEFAILKTNQEKRLLGMAKRMPRKFWLEHPELRTPQDYEKPILGYTLHKVKEDV